MSIIHELIDNMALQILEKPNGQVWFCNLELKDAYSQLKMCKKRESKQLQNLGRRNSGNISVFHWILRTE